MAIKLYNNMHKSAWQSASASQQLEDFQRAKFIGHKLLVVASIALLY